MNQNLPSSGVASSACADTTRPSCPAGDAHDCVLSCTDVCALHPGEKLEPIDFAEARARFQREATRGVCNTGRYRMAYYVWGEGPPLLFVHGLGDSAASFLLPIARLCKHFRCIAYEQPSGQGDSARVRRYQHDHLVADIWALLDHLGLGQSYILGSSFGSTIVLKALYAGPERLPRGILQGGLAHRPLRRAERLLAYWGRFLPGRMARVPWREKLLLKSVVPPFCESSPDLWTYFVEHTGRCTLAAVAHQAHMMHELDLRSILPGIRQPVLLLCGDQDLIVPRFYEEVLLQGLPNAGRVVVAGCGHMPSFTHPEIYAEVIRQFLTPPAR